MKKLIILTIVLSTLASLAHLCEPPDCDRKDCGTCANSCCNLEYFINVDPITLYSMLTNILTIGGPDQHYNFTGGEDLRPYHVDVYFILQGIHTTFVKKYNDTLNFVISPTNNTQHFQSLLKAFSISQIHGAYCDAGQNYKNLIQLIKALNVDYIEVTIAGCQPPVMAKEANDERSSSSSDIIRFNNKFADKQSLMQQIQSRNRKVNPTTN